MSTYTPIAEVVARTAVVVAERQAAQRVKRGLELIDRGFTTAQATLIVELRADAAMRSAFARAWAHARAAIEGYVINPGERDWDAVCAEPEPEAEALVQTAVILEQSVVEAAPEAVVLTRAQKAAATKARKKAEREHLVAQAEALAAVPDPGEGFYADGSPLPF